MGISTDPRQLEQLKQLEGVLGLLQNPESYTRLLASVKATIKQQEEISARYPTVVAAENFLNESRKILETTKAESKRIAKELEDKKVAFAKDSANVEAAVETRTAAVAERERQVALLIQKLEQEQAKFASDKSTFAAESKVARDNLEAQRQKLDAAEKALLARVAQLKEFSALPTLQY